MILPLSLDYRIISPFREDLFSRNFAYAKFRGNETLAKISASFGVCYDIEASQVIISRYMYIIYLSLKIDFILENSADPYEMPRKRHFLLVFTVCQSTCLGFFS